MCVVVVVVVVVVTHKPEAKVGDRPAAGQVDRAQEAARWLAGSLLLPRGAVRRLEVFNAQLALAERVIALLLLTAALLGAARVAVTVGVAGENGGGQC